ncbi:hypothetical protein [Streptomyces sp. S1]|uniref:hypothetical protein n=1 Tax=Streptomyces sp. S1 TaxID=718288 RepID=UPI003D710A98
MLGVVERAGASVVGFLRTAGAASGVWTFGLAWPSDGAGRTGAAWLRWIAGGVGSGAGGVAPAGRVGCTGGAVRAAGAGRGASVFPGVGGAGAVVVQSAPGARRVRRTTGRRWTGALGVPPGAPGPAGETGPGTFWGRSAAEDSGAAAAGSSIPGVRAGAGATGPAVPTGDRRRDGRTGRAEISGERRTGSGAPPLVTARPTDGAEAPVARRTGAAAASSRTGAAVTPPGPAGPAAVRCTTCDPLPGPADPVTVRGAARSTGTAAVRCTTSGSLA